MTGEALKPSEDQIRWVADTLQAVLLLIRLECRGQPFEPTALRIRITPAVEQSSTATPRGIPPALAAREEPEIHHAWLTLRTLLEQFELLVGEDVVEPDSFTLRRVEDWVYEQDSPAAMLAALARPCPYRCAFCYEDGLPDAAWPLVRPPASNDALDLRFALWAKGLDVAGFQGLRYGEILPHPRFAEALRVTRHVADRPISIATAGAGLTEEKLRALAGKPRVLLQLSLNSCDSENRRRLMGDRRARELVNMLPHFRKHDVAWTASAVAWPGLSFDDLTATVRTAQEYGALHFVLFLPSYSKYFSRKSPFDGEGHWQDTVPFIRELRTRVQIPIRVAPDSWEAGRCFDNPLSVEIIGTTIGSAADGKLQPGDQLTAIGPASDGGVLTRAAANRVLEQTWQAKEDLPLSVLRNGETLDVRLSIEENGLAGVAELDAPFGVHIYSGPDEKHLARAVQLLRFASVRSGWVLSAQLLAKPYELLWQQYRGMLKAGDLDLRFIPVPNRFWGGNIMVGDLLTVDDFVQAVQAERERLRDRGRLARTEGLGGGRDGCGPRMECTLPEVLLVPFSPFHPAYWRDLTGASFLQIERRTGLLTFPLVTGS